MVVSQSRVSTEMAQRYMSQLCKHFEHKLPVTLEAQNGRIEFASGICSLAAEDGVLTLRAEAADDGQLARLEDVVVRHLERFSFRDKPEIAWSRVAD